VPSLFFPFSSSLFLPQSPRRLVANSLALDQPSPDGYCAQDAPAVSRLFFFLATRGKSMPRSRVCRTGPSIRSALAPESLFPFACPLHGRPTADFLSPRLSSHSLSERRIRFLERVRSASPSFFPSLSPSLFSFRLSDKIRDDSRASNYVDSTAFG